MAEVTFQGCAGFANKYNHGTHGKFIKGVARTVSKDVADYLVDRLGEDAWTVVSDAKAKKDKDVKDKQAKDEKELAILVEEEKAKKDARKDKEAKKSDDGEGEDAGTKASNQMSNRKRR